MIFKLYCWCLMTRLSRLHDALLQVMLREVFDQGRTLSILAIFLSDLSFIRVSYWLSGISNSSSKKSLLYRLILLIFRWLNYAWCDVLFLFFYWCFVMCFIVYRFNNWWHVTKIKISKTIASSNIIIDTNLVSSGGARLIFAKSC